MASSSSCLYLAPDPKQRPYISQEKYKCNFNESKIRVTCDTIQNDCDYNNRNTITEGVQTSRRTKKKLERSATQKSNTEEQHKELMNERGREQAPAEAGAAGGATLYIAKCATSNATPNGTHEAAPDSEACNLAANSDETSQKGALQC